MVQAVGKETPRAGARLLLPYVSEQILSADRTLSVHRVVDVSGRVAQLRLFERNSGLPADLRAVRMAQRLSHVCMARLRWIGSVTGGATALVADGLSDAAIGATGGRPTPAPDLRLAAAQLAALLAFLHHHRLTHDSISSRSVHRTRRGFVLGAPESIRALNDSTASIEICRDLQQVGVALIEMAVGVGFRKDSTLKDYESDLKHVTDPALRDLISLALDGSSLPSATDLLATAMTGWKEIPSEVAMACVGRRRIVDSSFSALIGTALSESQRGAHARLFLEGRWGTARSEMIEDALDLAPPGVLSMLVPWSGRALESAEARLESALQTAASRFGAPLRVRGGPAGERMARLTETLLSSTSRAALALALEIDPDPLSDDAVFVGRLSGHLRGLPVLLLPHATKVPRSLPAEFPICRLELPEPSQIAARYHLPGPAAESILKRIARESGGNLDLFTQGLRDAVQKRGARVIDGSWSGAGTTVLFTTPKDLLESFTPPQRALLRLLHHCEAPLPAAFFTAEELRLVGEMAPFVHLVDGEVTLAREFQPSLRKWLGPSRAGKRDALQWLESRRLSLGQLAMAALLAEAGRKDEAALVMETAGLDALRQMPGERARRLFALLAPTASRMGRARFWELRGDWASAGEQYREATGSYGRAIALDPGRRFDLGCKVAAAAEAAADYRLAVRSAELLLAEDTLPDAGTELTLRRAAARCRYLLGDNHRAAEHWKQALRLCQTLPESSVGVGRCLRDYGYFLHKCGEVKEAFRMLRQAERRLREAAGGESDLAQTRHYLGLLLKETGDFDAAQECLNEAKRIYSDEGNLLRLGMVTSDLGSLFLDDERFDEARQHLEASLEVFQRIHNPRALSLASFNLAETLLNMGDYEQARRLLRRCLSVDRSSGNLRSLAYDLSSIGLVAYHEGQLDEARQCLQEALEIFRSQEDHVESTDALLKLARLDLDAGGLDEARRLLESLPREDRAGSRRIALEADLLRGRLDLLSGAPKLAMQRAQSVVARAGKPVSLQAAAHQLLAEAHCRMHQHRPAAVEYSRALEAARSCGIPHVELAVRLSMLECAPKLIFSEEGSLNALEDLLDRSRNPHLLRRYRQWMDARAKEFDVVGARRIAPPGVESEVYRISRLVGQGVPAEEISGSILDAIRRSLRADVSLLTMRDAGHGETAIVIRRGLPEGATDAVLRLCAKAIDGRASVMIAAPSDVDPGLKVSDVISAVAVPIFRSGDVGGAIYLDRRGLADPFSSSDVQFVEALAEGLAIGLRGALEQPRPRDLPAGASHPALGGIITASERMRAVLEAAARVAPHPVGVLILGESGTGKELVARAIHEMSGRSAARFISVNCSAIPENLLESEFFGFRRGAFTDARSDKPGLLEEANAGTLFLDEIGDMPLRLQAKLLRAVQEKEIRRIGETRSRSLDVRIIAATHRDLESEVRAGRFREDLYYRLKVATLSLPPLRERREDLAPLAEYYIRRYSREYGCAEPRLGVSARAWLLRQQWPGNVRELQNSIQRALLAMGEGGIVLEREHFEDGEPAEPGSTGMSALRFADACARFERSFLIESLRRTGGNRTVCAQDLGLSRQGLFKLLRRHGIS